MRRTIDDLQEREAYVVDEPIEVDEVVLQTYSLQIIGPFDDEDMRRRVMANLAAITESVEEDVTDLLPDGFRARVIAWDEED